MPASLLSDMERNSKDLHHTRAYELALELSMMGFANENESPSTSFDSEIRNKRSQNTTECVPVPSSEHVAEIVGRQGCKIKALRTKTNTYIKTPVRGEEPVFVVTGRREDVNAAKREILSAAEHFSQIRAQRKNNLNSSLVPGPNSIIPGQKTIQVRVPYHVVGLVVGPKGATIKRIQQLTNTYIVTPSRDKQPVFEVTGFPDNVESARKEIEAHIAVRTGSLAESDDDFDFSVYTNNLNAVNCGLFKTDFDGELIHPFSFESNNTLDLSNDTFNLPLSNVNSKDSDLYSAMYTNSITNVLSLYDAEETLNNSPVFDASGLLVSSSWPDFRSCPLTNSLSLLGSSSVRTTTECSSPRSNAFNDFVLIDHSTCATTDTSTAPFDQNCLSKNNSGNTSISSFPLFLNGMCNSSITDLSSNTTTSSVSDICRNSRPTEASAFCRKPNRDCLVCHERKVDAALVPCGHNLFCLMCANHLCEKSECPVCHQSATQAIRIYS